jgi:hypothetical protein
VVGKDKIRKEKEEVAEKVGERRKRKEKKK